MLIAMASAITAVFTILVIQTIVEIIPMQTEMVFVITMHLAGSIAADMGTAQVDVDTAAGAATADNKETIVRSK